MAHPYLDCGFDSSTTSGSNLDSAHTADPYEKGREEPKVDNRGKGEEGVSAILQYYTSSTKPQNPTEIILPHPHSPISNLTFSPHRVKIQNARQLDFLDRKMFDLGREGFCWVRHRSQVDLGELRGMGREGTGNLKGDGKGKGKRGGMEEVVRKYILETEKLVWDFLEGKREEKGRMRLVKAWDWQIRSSGSPPPTTKNQPLTRSASASAENSIQDDNSDTLKSEVSSHTKERVQMKGNERYRIGKPSKYPHIDQSPAGAIRRAHHHLGSLAPELLKGRFRIINIWRPLSPIYSHPLALCESRSISPSSLIPKTRIKLDGKWEINGFVGESLVVRWEKEHRWWFLEKQSVDEVTVVGIWDSEGDTRCVHTGFEPEIQVGDERGEGEENIRESIEVRVMVCYWPDEESWNGEARVKEC